MDLRRTELALFGPALERPVSVPETLSFSSLGYLAILSFGPSGFQKVRHSGLQNMIPRAYAPFETT
jgi:hypothetical protein